MNVDSSSNKGNKNSNTGKGPQIKGIKIQLLEKGPQIMGEALF